MRQSIDNRHTCSTFSIIFSEGLYFKVFFFKTCATRFKCENALSSSTINNAAQACISHNTFDDALRHPVCERHRHLRLHVQYAMEGHLELPHCRPRVHSF